MTSENFAAPLSQQPTVIAEVEHFIRRFCILPESAYLPLATWVVATYVCQAFDAFPYISLVSPLKRCGKTRVLEVMELLSAGAWRGTSPTSAALYRMMESCPTLLLDEVEALRGRQVSETQQAMLAVLNAGHRKGATVPRCDGPNNEVRHFPVFGPKAFAAIGGLPDTLSDRCICIMMQRKTAAQSVERFLCSRAKTDAHPLSESLTAWAKEQEENVRVTYESMSDLRFLTDREADLWMPLFAVCAVASADRVEELGRCSQVLTRAKAADDLEDSFSLRVLAAVRSVWPVESDNMTTASLLERLSKFSDGPLNEYDLTPRSLSRMLRPFGAVPRTVRVGRITAKGYLHGDLKEAFSRYLSSMDDSSVTFVTTRTNTAEVDDFASVTKGSCDGSEE